jgi:putative exporter of polyketide antibiotics
LVDVLGGTCFATEVVLKVIAELCRLLEKAVAGEDFEAVTAAVATTGFVQGVGDLTSRRLLKHVYLCLAPQFAHWAKIPTQISLAGTGLPELVGLDPMLLQGEFAEESAVGGVADENCSRLVA